MEQKTEARIKYEKAVDKVFDDIDKEIDEFGREAFLKKLDKYKDGFWARSIRRALEGK